MKLVTSNSRGMNQLFLAFFLLFGSLTGAYAACCAGHGGVASCNKSTGHQMCKDGTASPTCTCAVPKTSKKSTTAPLDANSKSASTTAPATSTSTKPAKPASHWWNKKPATTTTAPATSTKAPATSSTSAKGCCSNHGGVAQCNKSTHHQMCKDGSASPTCTCQ